MDTGFTKKRKSREAWFKGFFSCRRFADLVGHRGIIDCFKYFCGAIHWHEAENGFSIGIAVAAYEWIAAIALIIVAVWFILFIWRIRYSTMPQFLKTRYNETVAWSWRIFWLFLYVFVNLTSILFLGAVAINNLWWWWEPVSCDRHRAFFIRRPDYLGWYEGNGFTDVIQVSVPDNRKDLPPLMWHLQSLVVNSDWEKVHWQDLINYWKVHRIIFTWSLKNPGQIPASIKSIII